MRARSIALGSLLSTFGFGAVASIGACNSIISTKEYFYQANDDGAVHLLADGAIDTGGNEGGHDESDGAPYIGPDGALVFADGAAACTVDCMGGACVNGVCQPAAIATFASLGAIAIDDKYLYIAETSSILQVPKPGTATLLPFASFSSTSGPAAVRGMKAAGNNLYVAVAFSEGSSAVSSVPLPQGVPSTVTMQNDDITDVAFANLAPSAPDASTSGVFFLDTDGLAFASLVPKLDPVRIATFSGGSGGGQLVTSDVAQAAFSATTLGAYATPYATVNDGDAGSVMLGSAGGYVAVDDTQVYFANGSVMYAAPLGGGAGGTTSMLFNGPPVSMSGIVTDSSNLYIADKGHSASDGALYICKKPCTTPVKWIAGLDQPTALIADATTIYFLSLDVTGSTTVSRVAKP